MEPFLDDPFLDRVRRAYRMAIEAGVPASSRMWRDIDARRGDVDAALLAGDNFALRAIFANPAKTDLYFGVDNLCRSITGASDRRPFLELAMTSHRAVLARYQAQQLQQALAAIQGVSVIEIGPGVGHCAFFSYLAGVTDYTTIDLPLGMVAQARFLAEALGPDKIWMDGDANPSGKQLKLCSVAHLPDRHFDVVLNVDSMTEMSLRAALDYASWINQHARLFISMNHEVNPFTVADLAKHSLAAKRSERFPVPNRPGYVQETFLIDPTFADNGSGILWFKAKSLFWSVAVPIGRRLPIIRHRLTPG